MDKNLYYKIHSASLGDTLASTPTLRKLFTSYGKKINVVTHNKEIFLKNNYAYKLYDFQEFENLKLENQNIEIFESFLGVGGERSKLGVEKKHNTIDIRQFHAIDLGFMLQEDEMEYDYVADAHMQINYLPQNYICLHVADTWPSRTYSDDNWQQLINIINEKNVAVVLVGKNSYETGFYNINKPTKKLNLKIGLDLTNKLSLSQCWHVINKSKYFITMDSGLLHLAGTTDTNIIQLGSSINYKLRAPYRKNSQSYKYKYVNGSCNIFCASDIKYGVKEWKTIQGVPPLINCLENKKSFECHPVVGDVIKNIDFSLFENKDSFCLAFDSSSAPTKYLFIVPHLSTGGSPKYLEWLIQNIKKSNVEIKVLEWNVYSYDYTVQRNNIIDIVGKDNFKSVGGYWDSEQYFIDKEKEILQFINSFDPHYIHLNEFSEDFAIKGLTKNIIDFLYNKNRKFKLFETSHKAYIDFNTKTNIPDELWLCSDYHYNKAKNLNLNIKKVEMDLPPKDKPNRDKTLKSLGLDPSKFHVLQVGLFSTNKNQKFTFDLAKKFINNHIQFHFIGNTCFIDECHINKNQANCRIWGERSDVDVFMSCMDLFVMPSYEELNPISIKEALSWKMPCFISKIDTLYEKYKDNPAVSFIEGNNLEEYMKQKQSFQLPSLFASEPNQVIVSFNPSARVEILGNSECKYKIKFIDKKRNICHYESEINTNMWSEAAIKYFVDWKIEVYNLTFDVLSSFELDLNSKTINIINESSSLGDAIAWMSSVDRFQKKNKCIVNYFTAKKDIFQENYKNINFYDYDDALKNTVSYCQYKLGCFKDKNLISKDWKTINLQNVSDEILGLSYEFIKPKIKINPNYKTNLYKYVCIATQSTSQSRYWNKKGWENVVDFLHENNYKVICVDKNYSFGNKEYMNHCPSNVDLFVGNETFEKIVNIIDNCEFFIGLSSGLSWLSWALNKDVILISGSVAQYFEFYTRYRITNFKTCNSCFNNSNHEFDPSNWSWCPENKNFECSREISFEMVKQKINECFNKSK